MIDVFPRVGAIAKKICVALRVQMSRQSWALEPGQIAAVLFSDDVTDEEKSRIAARILALAPKEFSVPNPEDPPSPPFPPINARIIQPTKDDIHRGKPPLPEITSSNTLLDFVTPRSIIFLARFCPNPESWLRKNPPWDHIPEYAEAKEIVRGIMPVNDPAERLCATAKRYKVHRDMNFFNNSNLRHKAAFESAHPSLACSVHSVHKNVFTL